MGSSSPGRSSRLPLRRVLLLPLTAAVGAAVVLPLTVPVVARAGGADPAESSAQVSATVVLRTGAGPEALARAGALPRAARLDRLALAAPSGGLRAGLVDQARHLGLTVKAATSWSLVVRGTEAHVDQLRHNAAVAQVLVSGGPSPTAANSPTQLRGAQLRTAYAASATVPPSSAVTPIVGTIQLAGWDSSELAGYIHAANSLGNAPALPALAPAQFTAVSVGHASTTSGGVVDGAREVAVDQEAIYDADPYAKQRAYFADPSAAGMVAALDQVADDAVTMPGLLAVSISWFWCEAQLSPSDTFSIHGALTNVLAAGVTVFAATGDTGSNCGGSSDVAYPASDPLVIAVGGTTLTVNPPVETGWSGSGGGTSHYPSPSWQMAVTGDGKREVPDIAADADLNTGVYTWHDDGKGLGPGWDLTGGTSLATAAMSALYVAELGTRGATDGGLGDLHQALYSAPAADFRDVTTGSNGGHAAIAGYDMVTGLGAPLWHKLVDVLLTQPVISVPATLDTRVVPVTVSAPAGQNFLAWATGYGTPPAVCGVSTGHPDKPDPVTVPADGTYQIWAQGYVGHSRCFTVSTTTVVCTTPSPAPTAAPTPTAPPTSAPLTTPPVTTPPPTSPPPALLALPADVRPPALTISSRRSSPRTAAVAFSWTAMDGAGSGVASAVATVLRDGRPIWTAPVQPSASMTFNGVGGHAYRLSVVAVDNAGNAAGLAGDVVRLPFDDRSYTLSKGWRRATSASAYEGSYLLSARKGASASISTTGSVFSLLTATGPAEGLVEVYVDGRHVRDVSLYSAVGHSEVTVSLARFRTAGRHRISLLVKGKHAPAARASTVTVDGLLVS